MMDPIYARLEPKEIKGWIDDDGEPVKSAVISMIEKPTDNDKKIHADIMTLRDAWIMSGSELNEKKNPYITEAALKTFLVDKLGIKESSASQYVKAKARGKLANRLICAKIIREFQDGFEVINDDAISDFMIVSNQ